MQRSAARQGQQALESLWEGPQAGRDTGKPGSDYIPLWSACGGLNGPNQKDEASQVPCESRATCNRLDRWSWYCQPKPRRPGDPSPGPDKLPPPAPSRPSTPTPAPAPPLSPPPAPAPDAPAAQGAVTSNSSGPEYSFLPAAGAVGRPQEPQPQNDTEAQAPATEAPAAPAAPAEPAVDLKLGFPAMPLENFTAQYQSGALATVAAAAGVPASNISVTTVSAPVPVPTPAPTAAGRRRRRRALLAEQLVSSAAALGPAVSKLEAAPPATVEPAAEQPGTLVEYKISAEYPAAAEAGIRAAAARGGEGFYSALARNGVPLRPSIILNGEQLAAGSTGSLPPVDAAAPAAARAPPAAVRQAAEQEPSGGAAAQRKLSSGALAGIIAGSIGGARRRRPPPRSAPVA
ncbi:hypothetical protein MNEG_7502 [Monoraphidium neglectum]|uniref:CBM1 domain-containing protein n=1 Tax=Monoraphidium neglectum TaxID=145388 RepID=A0A0D2JMQ2_9CHLO|nr:hypothetical protein MNEG_7502 [Monoraphidium neglectum]KIZ00463.1 hypothetical protein MNEG_7502 [Monoraphidium neglectum]|eukprot:XP_013899482.1 hypothetical protein MNEG_7502 [Monoraphidium neglectum]